MNENTDSFNSFIFTYDNFHFELIKFGFYNAILFAFLLMIVILF